MKVAVFTQLIKNEMFRKVHKIRALCHLVVNLSIKTNLFLFSLSEEEVSEQLILKWRVDVEVVELHLQVIFLSVANF